jgi:hypothetical protein
LHLALARNWTLQLQASRYDKSSLFLAQLNSIPTESR